MSIDELLATALNVRAVDTTRIHAIEELLLAVQSERERDAVARALVEIAAHVDDDYLVRQIASRDLSLYPRPENERNLLSIATDEEDDLDVRVNIVVALARWKSPALQTLRATTRAEDPLAVHLSQKIHD